ncbi:MAG: class I SAM-dependent methyltransferase [Acidobacteriota bacterium]|nr:class I SAM-dependent methyltransferase [Acidobacteriota bacterium]
MTIVRTVSEADLARLKQARHDADTRYNDALTALDAAIEALPPLPAAPPAPDEAQVTPLNQRWEVTRALSEVPGGIRGRLARFVLGLIRPALDQQQAFNSAIVDHLNRNVAAQRAVPEAVAAIVDVVRRQSEQLALTQSRLIAYLQQVTPYIDTKDYEFHGLATRIAEDVAHAHEQLADTVRGLAAALSGVSDDVLKRWERYESLRTSLGIVQMTVQALRRELTSAGGDTEDSTRRHLPAPDRTSPHLATPDRTRSHPSGPAAALWNSPLSSHRYVAFEDLFRGDRSLIRERQDDYVRLFAGRQDVLDIGCGRGEFLQLLAGRGIRAIGVDLNHEMVALCRDAHLDVHEADALGYLRGRADGSLGGLIAAQVVEHLEPDYLAALLDEAFRVLSSGSPIVLETINVASWSAFFSSYLRDLTHVRPLHPDTLKFIVTASGFLDADIQWRAPLPDSEKLVPAPTDARAVDVTTSPEALGLVALAEAFDRNVARLNAQLYGPFDYAVVAWKH